MLQLQLPFRKPLGAVGYNMTVMSDEEMGELLEVMDRLDDLTILLPKLRRSVRFSPEHRNDVDEVMKEGVKLASLIEKTCRAHCPPEEYNSLMPDHFQVARRAWARANQPRLPPPIE